VLASVLGVALAINFGFAATSLVAAVCYLAALAHAALGRWPEPEVAAGTVPTPPTFVASAAQASLD
jgi:hypothetical protein